MLDLDTDNERLPDGLSRVGYDADTGTYSYQDSDGRSWEGVPGHRYGALTLVGNSSRTSPFEVPDHMMDDSQVGEVENFLCGYNANKKALDRHEKHSSIVAQVKKRVQKRLKALSELTGPFLHTQTDVVMTVDSQGALRRSPTEKNVVSQKPANVNRAVTFDEILNQHASQ